MNSEHQLEPTKRKDGSDTLPARGYSWEPFLPDHLKSLVHGARSPRIVEAVARVIQSEVVAEAPWLVSPIFGDALERYCRSEAKARILDEHILKVCDEQGAAKVSVRLWESSVQCSNAANRAAEALGLTPLSRARLAQLTTSVELSARNLEDLGATGAEIRRRRAAAIDSETGTDEDEPEAQDED